MTDDKANVAETPDNDIRGDKHDEYADEWEDLTERELLQGIFIELTQIRALLSDADTGASRQSEESEEYECVKCGTVMPRGDCARHAESEHRAPPGEWQSLFEAV